MSRPARDRRHRRLSVEPLEDRRLLSVASFQDGVLPTPDYEGTRDVPLFGANESMNFGDETPLRADAEQGSTGFPIWSLIKWDLSGIPADSTINDVSITVNVSNTTVAPGFDLFAMRTPWVESEATWIGPTSTSTWEEPGVTDPADFHPTVLGTMTGTATGPLTVLLNSAGRAVVAGWLADPANNHGFLISNPANDNSLRFDSREATTRGNRPKLSIDFTFNDVEPPTVALIHPLDNGPADENASEGEVRVGVRDSFVIGLDDFALDDTTVTAETLTLTKDAVPFADFTFAFDATADQITLRPTAGSFAEGLYTVTLNDGDAKIADATGNILPRTVLTIAIDAALPTTPVAEDDAYQTGEDTPLVVNPDEGVLDNDSGGNAPGDAVLVSGPSNGTLELNPDGSFTYTPAADFAGQDSFTYTLVTPLFTSNLATATIDIAPLNDVPVALDDTYRILVGETLDVTMPLPSQPVRWRAEDGGNGNFYAVSTTTASWAAARDAAVASTFRGVNGHLITITSAEERNFVVSNLPSGKYWIGLFQDRSAPDFSEPAGGWRWITGEPYVYTSWGNSEPNNLNGEDCATAGPGSWNDLACQFIDPRFLIEYEFPPWYSAVGLLANDTDADGDPLTVQLVQNVSHGTLMLGDDGTFSYTPDVGFAGIDTFTYIVSDGQSVSGVATVTIRVNAPPIATDDVYDVTEDNVLSVDVENGVLANDADPNDPLTAVLVSGPAHGTVELAADGSFTYTPEADFFGDDTFTYRASDGTIESNVATVMIEVDGVADAPMASDDSFAVVAGGKLSIDAPGLLANDADGDGDELTAVLLTEPQNGELTFSADGAFSYSPDPLFVGVDTFTYAASDEQSESPATVTISVHLPGSIRGTVWNDESRDGVFDAGEPGLADWTVFLDANENGLLDADESRVQSDAEGNYEFPGLLPGDYAITVEAPSDWQPTSPAARRGELTFVQELFNGSNGIRGLDQARGMSISPDGQSIYVSSLTEDAVSVYDRDPATGQVTFVEVHVDGVNGVDGLNYGINVKVSPDGRHVYATAKDDSAIAHFDRDVNTGRLTFIDHVRNGVRGVNGLSGAAGLAISEDGRHVYASARQDGAVAVFSRNAQTGTLTFVHSMRGGVAGTPEIVYANHVTISPDGGSVYVGGANNATVAVFSRDAVSGRLTFVESLRNGVNGVDGLAGVYHLVVSTDNAQVYAVGRAGALATFSRDVTTGRLTPLQLFVNGVDGITGLAGATEVSVSSDGQSVYVVSIDSNSIVVFDRSVETGELAVVQTLREGVGGVGGVGGLNRPYSVVVSPDGDHVYTGTQAGHSIAAFGRDFQLSLHVVEIEAGEEKTGVDFGNYSLAPPFPVVRGDSYTGLEDETLVVDAAAGVLANDSDPQGDEMTAVLSRNVREGTLTLNPDGSFTYQPNENFAGLDSFRYRASDGEHESASTLVQITIENVNDPPVAVDDEYVVNQGDMPGPGAETGGFVIDSVLGRKSIYVPGIGSMSQQEIARRAAVFALSPEGWNLGVVGGQRGKNGSPHWFGGTEWNVSRVPAVHSDNWGYDLNADAINRGNARGLQFHTDDTVSQANHDIGEPSSFGVISGVMSGTSIQLGVRDWGTFRVDQSISPVFPTYDMLNGQSGIFPYVDEYYSGVGDATEELSALTNGRGDLTDGVVAPDNWNVISTRIHSPYVGWETVDPTIAFSFGLPVTVQTVRIHVDNSLDGAVALPGFARIAIAGQEFEFPIAADSNRAPRFIDLDLGAGVFAEGLELTLARRIDAGSPPRWLMLSEVEFEFGSGRGIIVTSDIGVLANDNDVDGDVLEAILVDDVQNGALVLRSDGSFTYTVDRDFVGIDTFTYVVSDGESNSNIAAVTIRVGLEDLPADLTGDGFVDFGDLTLLLANWDRMVSAAKGNLVNPATSKVDFADLTALLAAWTGSAAAGSPQAAAVGGDFVGDFIGAGPSVAVGDASYRRHDESPRRGATDAADSAVMLKHNLRATFHRRDAGATSARRGAYGRLQAVAVDRAMEEPLDSTLRRRGSAFGRRRM